MVLMLGFDSRACSRINFTDSQNCTNTAHHFVLFLPCLVARLVTQTLATFLDKVEVTIIEMTVICLWYSLWYDGGISGMAGIASLAVISANLKLKENKLELIKEKKQLFLLKKNNSGVCPDVKKKGDLSNIKGRIRSRLELVY